MIPNQNILTELTAAFNSAAISAIEKITPYAKGLFFQSSVPPQGLIIIDLLLVMIMFVVGGSIKTVEGQIKPSLAQILIYRSLKYCSFFFIVTSYGKIIDAIIHSFIKIGGIVGGTPIPESTFTNPSLVSQMGIDLIMPYWETYLSNNFGKVIFDLFVMLFGTFTGGATAITLNALQAALGIYKTNSIIVILLLVLLSVLIIGCFFYMAINLFATQIEFAILSALSIILIPFGIWEHTKFIFEKAERLIIDTGIRYMVLVTIMSIVITVMKTLQMPVTPTYQQLIYLFIAVSAITALTVFIPNKIIEAIA